MPEWERVPLGDLLVSVPASRREAVDPDKKYRLLGVRLNNEGAFLRETKKGSESSAPSLYRVESGDFIYSRLFAWRGAFGLIPPELDGCYVSNEFPLFRAKDDRLDLEWLDYWFHLQDVIRTVEADCTGSTPLTRNRYKETFFLALEIPLPPLPEQQRIVARVKGLVDKVEEARRLREESADLQTLLGQQWRSEQFAHFGTVQLADIVGEAGFQNGYSPTRSETGSLLGLSLSGIRDGKIDPSHAKPIVADRDCTPYLMQRGDVFVVRGSGSKDLVGQAAIYHSDEAVVFPDLMIRIRLDQAEIDPNYFVEYWNSRLNRDWLKENAKTTSGIWKVSQKQLRYAPIPLPKLDEQAEVVERLKRMRHVLDALYSETSITQYELQALPSAILAQAFAGAL